MFKYLLKKYRHYKKLNTYKIVAILYASVNWADNNATPDIITYILKENGKGDRLVEIIQHGYCKALNKGESHPYYLGYILPWNKQMTDHIPSNLPLEKLLTS